jgi:hypothetical protein
MQELGRSSPAPLGFGRRQAQKRAAAMLLLGEVAASEAGELAKQPRADKVDALILRLADAAALPEGVADSLGGRLWGVSLSGATGEQLDTLHKAGCDFLLIDSRQAPAIVLREDEMARGLPIRMGITEEEARPLEDLPVDLLFLQSDPAWWPLTVERLIHLQATVSMVSKHILLKVTERPPKSDLPLIRDLPVDALVVDLAAIADDKLEELRGAIDELPPRKPRNEKGISPVLPRTSAAARHDEHEHEEEDDPDDFGDPDDDNVRG